MFPLAALLIATPIFGFQLSLDAAYMPNAPASMVSSTALAIQMAPTPELATDPNADSSDSEVDDTADDTDDDASSAPNTIAEQMQSRAQIAPLHKWMGITTWASMTITTVLGFVQYNNLYGFFSARENTPCVSGSPAFGQAACVDTPWPHLASSLLTAALYTSTLVLSMQMPDPIGLSEGDGDYAENLRLHKTLRWIHLIGMGLQMGLGLVLANSESFGLSRANDYDVLQALGTAHMAIGLVTYASLTWAGLLFLL